MPKQNTQDNDCIRITIGYTEFRIITTTSKPYKRIMIEDSI